MNYNRFNVLGVSVSAVNMEQTINGTIDKWIKNNHKNYIVLTGVHGVIEMQNDEELKNINNNSGLTTPDGMPLVWLGRKKGFMHIEKVYAPDIMMNTFKVSAKRGYKHFLYGGKENVAENLKIKLENEYPGIQIVGTYCPPFRQLEKNEVIEVSKKIDESGADIVWCGLGCPKQEKWMAKFRPLINAPVLIGVGAGFDFLSGEKPLAPDWIKYSGFEWLYRLLSDPKYLWRRYFKIVPLFIFYLILEVLHIKKFN